MWYFLYRYEKMRHMKRIRLLIFVCLLFVCGCTKETKHTNLNEEYEKLTEENHFYYAKKEGLESFFAHGTGMIFLGFPECPWCQDYVVYLEEVLSESEAKCAYYNIYTDKKQDRDFYDTIAQYCIDLNKTGEEIIQYDEEGLKVIYMPLVLFIEEGKIIAFDHETCMENSEEISLEDYWTSEKKEALKERLTPLVKQVKEKQDELNAQGCDTGCEAFENSD